MATVTINGVSIYYEVHGEGEPLVLIHHGIGCTRMWEELIPAFAERYKVIAYDRRGFGNSERGDNFRDYYISEKYNQNSVKELSALLEHLNINGRLTIVIYLFRYRRPIRNSHSLRRCQQ